MQRTKAAHAENKSGAAENKSGAAENKSGAAENTSGACREHERRMQRTRAAHAEKRSGACREQEQRVRKKSREEEQRMQRRVACTAYRTVTLLLRTPVRSPTYPAYTTPLCSTAPPRVKSTMLTSLRSWSVLVHWKVLLMLS